jgi:hypothetical protein
MEVSGVLSKTLIRYLLISGSQVRALLHPLIFSMT